MGFELGAYRFHISALTIWATRTDKKQHDILELWAWERERERFEEGAQNVFCRHSLGAPLSRRTSLATLASLRERERERERERKEGAQNEFCRHLSLGAPLSRRVGAPLSWRTSLASLRERKREREREDDRQKEGWLVRHKATYESLKRNLLSTFKKWPNFPLS